MYILLNKLSMSTEEASKVTHLSVHLNGLDSHIQDFQSAIDLRDYAQQMIDEILFSRRNMRKTGGLDTTSSQRLIQEARRFSRWQFIAVQHAAVTVAQFWDRLHAIKNSARKCPSLKNIVDWQSIDDGILQFGTDFPHRKDVRDGYAHSVDKAFSAEKIAQNETSDGIFVSNCINGNKIVHSINNQMVDLEISCDSLKKLDCIRQKILSAFHKVCDERSINPPFPA